MSTPKKRSPAGVVKELPIPVRFMPAERDEIIALAEQDGRTMGSFVRSVFLIGLVEWKRRQDMQ